MTTSGDILIVEDEALLALELSAILTEAGHRIAGTAFDLGEALQLVATAWPSLAVMDYSLCGETSEPLAALLVAEGIPFICITGYAASDLPAIFADRIVLRKPVKEAALLASIRQLLE